MSKKLLRFKTCSRCHWKYDEIPAQSHYQASGDEFQGHYWPCRGCETMLFHPVPDEIPGSELCQCIDCLSSGAPCHQDCDRERECEGCRQGRVDAEDYEFEKRKGLGIV